MAIRLKTKFTLTTALLVLGVVAVVSSVYVVTLTRQSVRQADERARFVAQQIFLQAQHALNDAAEQGAAPASERPEDLREYVRRTLDESAGLSGLIEAALGYSATIYEVTVVDDAGVVMLSSDASLPSRPAPRRTNFEQLVRSGFVEQLRVLYGPQNVYEVSLPFNLSDAPFGEIRIGVSTVFLRGEVTRNLESAGLLVLGAVLLSTLLAAAVSHVSLRPLEKISAQLDRITQGKFEPAAPQSGDELAQVSTKINLIGKQLHDVREIFSTLRENMAQVMAGLEDGLLLFTADGRNVLASPSVEKFLGVKPDALLGRRASEIFPAEHPLRAGGGLRMEGDLLERVEGAEAVLNGHPAVRSSDSGGVHRTPETGERKRRVGASVQVIEEGGSRMGALVTLRDLDSLERIGSQLEVSERLAALGRVTAGVAHEVKNPLNSMRLWIENLKEAVPQEQEVARQGLKILDSEIDRLDRVVRTFLDFNRPVELRLEETSLGELLLEVVAVARPQIEKAGVNASLECAEDVPPVRADRPLLKQALLNLVLNACEAMPEGGRLTLAVRAAGDGVQVTITDAGRGIPPEYRGKIFQLYFTTRPGGSGIGLATTFRIVQMHGGSIDFTSEVGHGTSFTIELPGSRPHGVAARARKNIHAQP